MLAKTRRPIILSLTALLMALLAAACGGPSDGKLEESQFRQAEQVREHEGEEAVVPSNVLARERAEGEGTSEGEGEDAGAAGGEGHGEGGGEAGEPGSAPSGEGDESVLSEEQIESARDLFSSSCGGCHALSDAGTSGAAGPGLDGTALSPEDIEAQIINGGGAMPPGLLQGEDATLVAQYVAAVAGD